MTRAHAHIRAMVPYALADLKGPDGRSLLSLSQNECLRPPSPKALEAAGKAMEESALYPDADWIDLRQSLAWHHGLDPAQILCGNGSLDLIGCLARTFAGPSSAVLVPAHAYPFFRSAAQMSCARCDQAPETGTTASIDALIQAVRPDTALVFIANPGNPTGTRVPASDLRRLRDALPDDTLLVIDQAYGEFADHADTPLFDLATTGNTIILRTFSKAYGLAGARVGWGVFPPVIASELRKVMNPNNVSTASQAAAKAALEDQDYMHETCALTTDLREAARTRLTAAGYAVAPSFTNFLLIELKDAATAQALDQRLRAADILLRAQAGAGLPHCLRMTIGGAEATDTALTRLEDLAREFT